MPNDLGNISNCNFSDNVANVGNRTLIYYYLYIRCVTYIGVLAYWLCGEQESVVF